jgi:hypothetical protein
MKQVLTSIANVVHSRELAFTMQAVNQWTQ